MGGVSGLEPSELRRIVYRVAGETAGLLRDLWGSSGIGVPIEGLKNRETIAADWEAESLIIELIKNEGLSGTVITEERGVENIGEGSLVFIVDPLDGSKNYVAGIPWCSVSIAVADPSRGQGLDSIVAGAVAPIFHGLTYSFDIETGCWEAGARVHRPERPFSMVLAYFEDFEGARAVKKYRDSTGHSGPVRSLGSAALEIIFTALGKAEVFIDARARLRSVDIAASIGFAQVAGAAFSDAQGNTPRIELDGINRIRSLVVGFNTEYWKNALEAVKKLELEE